MNLLLTIIFIFAIGRIVYEKRRKGVIALVKDPVCECISRIKKRLSPNVYKGRITTSAVCGVRNNLHWMRSGSQTISEISLLNRRHI